MKKDIHFSDYEQKIIDYLKKNKGKQNLFIATVAHVSKSGMSREIKFAIIYKGEFVNVSYLFKKVLDLKWGKHDGLKVQGCGMDMIFHTLDCFYSSLGFKGWKCSAVQHYKYF